MQNISCPNHQYSPPTCLPPGFRFHPTDEELITYYLAKKVADESFRDHAITEVDLNKHEPWDLPEKAKMMGEKEWYFFSHKDRKYPSGSRTNRATEAGYWKATGKDKEIFMKSTASTTARCSMSNAARKQLVGMKKTLVFYEGRAPRGLKSNWVMHEYRVHERASIASILGYGLAKLNQGRKEWVLCRVIHKKLRLSKRDDQYMKRDDTILNDAELLARFLLADDQQLSQLPPDQATPPLNIAGLDNLAAGPARSSLTVHSTGSSSSSDQLLPSLYSPAAHDCYSSLTNHNAIGAGLPSYSRASSYSAPLPRLPSDLESFWLQASPFLS